MPRSVCVLAMTLAAGLCNAASPPNIVLILCDDLGWSDVGCYGGEIATPNIDRLADEGLLFTQFYNNAKCTTTRASLITGLYPRARDANRWQEFLSENMVTLGEALRDAGYHTALVGKWHLGREATHPLRRGFDEFYGLLDGACNHFDPSRPDPQYKGGRVRYFADGWRRVTEFPEDFYSSDAFTDRAIKLIDQWSDREAPFFVHLCYTAPHYPIQAPPEDIARYRGKYLRGWDALREQRLVRQREKRLIDPAWRMSQDDSRAYSWAEVDREFEDLRMAVYAAMVDRMDRNIGRLLARLDTLGVADNTIVLFLSDNGGCAEEPGGRDPSARTPGPADDYVAVGPSWGWAQNAPFCRYKTWMHEGGVATPLVVRWPARIKPGTVTHQVGHIIDFMPTFIELAGGVYPADRNGVPVLPEEGVSLAPVFDGASVGSRTLAWDYLGCSAVRVGDWKLVWDRLTRRWELYDMQADRTETHDLAEDMPDRVRELASRYNEWAVRTENKVRPLSPSHAGD